MSFVCSLPLAALLYAACAGPAPFATGYVEGEYTLVAPVASARTARVLVARGDQVPAGTVLAEMEQADAEIALVQAEAELAAARSHLADLREGKRPEEIQVIEASLASARAEAAQAVRERDRLARLAERGAATSAHRDDAATLAEVAAARVARTEAELAVARLPARPQAIAQAEAAVAGAKAALRQAQWELEQRKLTLDLPITVYDVIRHAGEIAGPSAPVLSVLADNAVKLRLYVPEASLAHIAIGGLLEVHCDGCAEGLTARITYISDAAEFTPPVIYSLENRQKLVYLIEAAPLDGVVLNPGQIVDVTLTGGAG